MQTIEFIEAIEQPITTTTIKRGFLALKEENPALLREICSKGGKSAHAQGLAHQWTSEEAQTAGRKGGKRGFLALKEENPALLREICSKGGKSAHAQGLAHQWTSEEAQTAGRKGGKLGHRGPAKPKL